MPTKRGAGEAGRKSQSAPVNTVTTPTAAYPFSRDQLVDFLVAVDRFTAAVFAFMLPLDAKTLFEAAAKVRARGHRDRTIKGGRDRKIASVTPAVAYPFSFEELVDFLAAVDDLMAAIFQFMDTWPDDDALLYDVISKRDAVQHRNNGTRYLRDDQERISL